jgi:hypothetical protein
MSERALIYRGYYVEKKSGGFVVSKTEGGRALTSQPSLEFAQSWIDGELRKQSQERQR